MDLKIALIGTAQPTAVESDSIGPTPLNLKADNAPVLVFREARELPIRALSRQIRSDLLPRFVRNPNPTRHPNATFVDIDTNSGWDSSGAWVDGLKDLKGKKLERVPVDDGLYWGVMKFWYPNLQLEQATGQSETWKEPEEEPATAPTRRAHRRRTSRPRSSQARSR